MGTVLDPEKNRHPMTRRRETVVGILEETYQDHWNFPYTFADPGYRI